MNQDLIILIAAVSLLTGVVMWLLIRRRDPFAREIKRLIKQTAQASFSNILVPDGMGGEIHVEYLLLTQRGLLLLDTRNVSGVVFAGEQLDEWSATQDGHRATFQNPIPSLLDRIAAVKSLTPGVPLEAKIVFLDTVEFPKGHPSQVATFSQLVEEFALPNDSSDANPYETTWQALQEAVIHAGK